MWVYYLICCFFGSIARILLLGNRGKEVRATCAMDLIFQCQVAKFSQPLKEDLMREYVERFSYRESTLAGTLSEGAGSARRSICC